MDGYTAAGAASVGDGKRVLGPAKWWEAEKVGGDVICQYVPKRTFEKAVQALLAEQRVLDSAKYSAKQ